MLSKVCSSVKATEILNVKCFITTLKHDRRSNVIESFVRSTRGWRLQLEVLSALSLWQKFPLCSGFRGNRRSCDQIWLIKSLFAEADMKKLMHSIPAVSLPFTLHHSGWNVSFLLWQHRDDSSCIIYSLALYKTIAAGRLQAALVAHQQFCWCASTTVEQSENKFHANFIREIAKLFWSIASALEV